MKISINYDLMEKIAVSKKGYTLSRDTRIIAGKTILTSSLAIALGMTGVPILPMTELIISQATFHTLYNHFVLRPMFTKLNQKKALSELRILASRLRDLDMNASVGLLQEAEVYDTQYNIEHEEGKIPYVVQKKYIMVPTVYGDDSQNVSLLQEHKVGTKQYSLSKGTPVSKLKIGHLAYNQ